MPRHRVTSKPPARLAREEPALVLWCDWCAQHRLSPALAGTVWDALTSSPHPLAKRIVWTWRQIAKAETREARIALFVPYVQGVTAYGWGRLLEYLVTYGKLTHAEANAVLDGWLAVTDASGAWL
jgi:hypothetical protein